MTIYLVSDIKNEDTLLLLVYLHHRHNNELHKERRNGMTESTNDGVRKKGVSKGLVAIIVALVLVIGGSVAAFVLLNLSDKEKYFLAEKNTLDFLVEEVEDRYQPELEWVEQTEENPTRSTMELSAEYNDPAAGGSGTFDPSQFINNSTVTLTSEADMEAKKMNAKLKADIGGVEIDNFNVYITAEKLLVGLPFIEELLQIKDENLGSLLHEMDPVTFTGEESLNLDYLFDSGKNAEDLEYLKEEYGKMIYEEIPEDAFKTTEETVKVQDESLESEKIKFHLSEDQLKTIITKVLDKMKDDEKLKEIIEEQMALQQIGTPASQDINQTMKDFETGIKDAKESLKDFQIPDGLTSIIWVNDDKVVQRDFKLEMGPSKEELVAFTVKGSQLLKSETQSFNYDLGFSDNYSEGNMKLSGELSWKDQKAKDSINLSVEDMAITYDGSETLKDGKREFTRTFSYEDASGAGGSLIWDGEANYEKDQMKAVHDFSLESPGLSQDMFGLHINTEGKTIEKVEIPSEEDVKDLGSMSADEIMNYMETDVTPKFQQWIFGILAGSGNLGF